MRRVAVAIVAAIFALQGCGGPGGGGGRPPHLGPGAFRDFGAQNTLAVTLRRFDANADLQITFDEFEAVLKVDFEAADANGDGGLGYSETTALNGVLNGDTNVSPIIDWNGSGRVELDEFGAQWRTLFKRADADGDKILSEAELMRPPPRDLPPRPIGPPRGGKPPGGGPPGGGPPGDGPPGGRPGGGF